MGSEKLGDIPFLYTTPFWVHGQDDCLNSTNEDVEMHCCIFKK